jgi:hypothetical protein
LLAKGTEGGERKELLESAVAILREALAFEATHPDPFKGAWGHQLLATALHLQSDSFEGDKKIAALTEAMDSMSKTMSTYEDRPDTDIYSECKAELDVMTQKLAEARKGK